MKKSWFSFQWARGILAFFVLASCCSLQEPPPPNIDPVVPPTEIIPSERWIDWSGAGVYADGVKGIPEYPVALNVKEGPYNAQGDGVTDDTESIQDAISACPPGQAVLIPQGIYRISGTLHLAKGIVVRGEGPDKTKIIQSASRTIFSISGSESSAVTDAVSGYIKDSDTIVVADGGLFSPGDVVAIDQLNDPEFVTHQGTGTCTWCGRWGTNGTRALGETKLIKERSGDSITFTRPLYYSYEPEFLPQLVRVSTNPIRNAGIEDLYIESEEGTSDGHGIRLANCAYCWVRGVESYNTPRKHIELRTGAYSNEVRDCYFHGAQAFTSDRGYGINISTQSSDNLIENNIVYHVHYGIGLEAGGAGNVIGYNYVMRTEHYEPDWFVQSMGTHGSHCFMNLWEGNVTGKLHFDNYWGSGSHQMVFRNWITRQNPGTPVTSALTAALIDANNYYITFIGNILGTKDCAGVVEQIPYLTSYNNPVIWKIGFYCCSSTGDPDDEKSNLTLIRHGNYDYITEGLSWETNIADREFPDSLYHSSKPAWFGDLAWPPFAPERQDFNPDNPNKIPAQVVFESGPMAGLPFKPIKRD